MTAADIEHGRAELPEQPTALYQADCGKALDAWGVTRQFDFGQFVLLYHREAVAGVEASVPVVVFPSGRLNRVVEDEVGGNNAADDRAVQVSARTVVRSGERAFQDGKPPAGTLAGRVGGVPLELALVENNPLELLTGPSLEHTVIDLREALDGRPIASGGRSLEPVLDEAAQTALLDGRTVEALAEAKLPDGRVQRTVVRIRPAVTELDLDEAAVDTALASGLVAMGAGRPDLRLQRSAALDVALRTGEPMALTAGFPDGTLRRIRLNPGRLATSKPLAEQFTIADPSPFLRNPYLPALDGSALRVTVTAGDVKQLRTTGRAQFDVNGTPVTLIVTGSENPDDARGAHAPAPMIFTPTLAGELRSVPIEPLVTPRDVIWERRLAAGLPRSGAIAGSLPHLGSGVGPDGGHATGVGPVGTLPLTGIEGVGAGAGITWPENPPVPGVHLDADFLAWLMWMEALERLRKRFGPGGPAGPAGPGSPGTPAPTLPDLGQGLQVAVFLPWRQMWRFRGLSRGNLLSSIALAPKEERTIRVFSWERRAKALEQSTETETDMQQDYTSTTKDTEDVFRELTSKQDFNLQAHGEFDASYTPGVASIHLGASIDLSQEQGLQQVTRNSTQHVNETVRRATARVRSRRITKITESQESVQGEDVVRRIVNHNECQTLTLDYYEQLAHYRITTKFRKEAVKVVVLVDNPLRNTVFSNITLRTNETALRQALLTPELGDGFTAARLLASYDNAWVEARRVAEESKKVAELNRDRVKKPESTTAPADLHPGNPYEDAVKKALLDIRAAAKSVVSADIAPALDKIGGRIKPSDDDIKAGQRWLWRRLAENKVGGAVSDALTVMTTLGGNAGIDDARRLKDAFPSGASEELGRLASLPDTEKEDRALAGVIHPRSDIFSWAWWSGSCRDLGLYNPNDAGLAGAITRMSNALSLYEGKASEGEALLQHQEMINKGVEDQQAANWVDKLEMKYGLDVVADAQERQQALLQHLNEHADYYRYVLFQALPPGEQLTLLTQNAPQLRIGYFEPRVVSYTGHQLAIPLTPTGETELSKFVDSLADTLAQAANEAQRAADEMAPDDVILPTPGLVVETSLGRCCACEPHRRKMQKYERLTARSVARQAEAEAERRHKRLTNQPPQLEEFASPGDTVRVALRLERDSPTPPEGLAPPEPEAPTAPASPR